MTDPHKIELWDIEKIVPYEKNAKIHKPEQVDKLKRSIGKFGWTQPIVVDVDGVIIAGHGRRLAAIELGMKKVPVVCRRDLSKEEANALRLADNRVASTEYDMSMIEDELRELFEAGFEMDAIGFDEHEINFSVEDLGELDDAAFIDNISDAVETQRAENAQHAEDIDRDVAAPVTDALGFKRVTIEQSRTIRNLMVQVKDRTGKDGAEGLIDFLQSAM